MTGRPSTEAVIGFTSLLSRWAPPDGDTTTLPGLAPRPDETVRTEAAGNSMATAGRRS